MRDLIEHRGPDSGGEHISGEAFIGIRRLRVIDLVTGDQPISNEDGSIWAVLNGEIYNFQELRRELERDGHRFHTRSDTEVIVHAYEEFGEDAPRRLEGMFAFAVWDENTRRLLVARDRLGKKPLLYALPRTETFAFASEFRALLDDPDVDRSVDTRSIEAYLALGYIPAPLTAYHGISKLPAGHLAVWEHGRLRVARYWDLPVPATSDLAEEPAVDELVDRLRDAVRARLIADVPLGAFLSGGVDSSLVVALMAYEAGRVRTFSIGFEETDYSELSYARRVAERYGTEHHEMIVRPDVVAVAPLLARHYGEPFADSSAVAVYYLSKLTREHVTVALCGDGGDEVFGGYDRYRAMRPAAAMGRLPRPILAPLVGAVSQALRPWSARRGPALRARRFLASSLLPEVERYFALAGVFDAAQRESLLDPAFPRSDTVRCIQERAMGFGDNPAERANGADLRLYLPDDLLVKVDIASMASSLEVRAPFLDRRVVEFGVSLPTRHKLRRTGGKHILKRAAERFVPHENIHRQKMGFGVPVGEWFRTELRSLLNDTVLSERALQRGYFRPEAVRRLVDEHQRRAMDHTPRLWALFMFELWHRELLDTA